MAPINLRLSCSFSILCGQLKHTWLENQILNKCEDDIVYLRNGPGWAALGAEFPSRIEESKHFSENLENGFSPAQLVDRLVPFSEVPEATKRVIKEAVHRAYLEKSRIQEHKAPLNAAISTFENSYKDFLIVWKQKVCEENELELRSTWRAVLNTAQTFCDELGRLPRGIVLP